MQGLIGAIKELYQENTELRESSRKQSEIINKPEGEIVRLGNVEERRAAGSYRTNACFHRLGVNVSPKNT